jgi:cold-inducible RNA-binding protein
LSVGLFGAVQFETQLLGTIIVSKCKTAQKSSDMGTKLFVGNLSFDVIENDLQDLFSQAGSVNSVDIMQDRATGRSRGFGFVEMASEADTAKAITMFNGKEFKGRALTVNEARPREERGGGGGGGGYRGGGGGGGGGGRGYGGGGGRR